MIKIANAQFWVHDQDEALAFYTKTLGWEVRADVTMEEWNFRWLCVGPTGQDDVGLVLMPVPGPPMLDQQSSALLAELVAKGAAAHSSSRPRTARPAMTSCRRAASRSTIPQQSSPMGSTRRSEIRLATTSGSPKYLSSTQIGADRTNRSSVTSSPHRLPPHGADSALRARRRGDCTSRQGPAD